MSLTRIALRIAAVEALKGRTLVGGNVLDSEIGSLEVDADGNVRTEEDRPFVTVYTDAASTKDIGTSLRAMVVNGATDILFEGGITAAMTETDVDTDETKLIGVGIPATDRAFEFFLDLVMRQIGDTITDPENEWAQIFMGFIQSIVQVDRLRTASTADGIRLAGHQMKLTAMLIPDPVKGDDLKPTSSMARFLAKAETIEDAATQAQIAMIQAQIAGSSLPWHLVQRRYGLLAAESDALLVPTADENGGDITIVTVDASPAEQAGHDTEQSA